MRRDLDPLRVKFSGGLRNLRARGLRDRRLNFKISSKRRRVGLRRTYRAAAPFKFKFNQGVKDGESKEGQRTAMKKFYLKISLFAFITAFAAIPAAAQSSLTGLI